MSDSLNRDLPKTTYLADYQRTAYIIDSIDLRFVLDEDSTLVYNTLNVRRREGIEYHNKPIVLDGEDLELLSVKMDGLSLSPDQYVIDEESLSIGQVPETFVLEIKTAISPKLNTSLNGLYVSSNNFCTQCEAEGFRRITYMYDRPDVMTCYSTTIIADKEKYPVLLSNGNLVDKGEGVPAGFEGYSLQNNTQFESSHWVRWEDPFPKPTYLFALVAGDLACVSDHFETLSGKNVVLQIFVQHHNVDKCEHAMQSLKNAMQWDEKIYGREYDLEIYMIVAVDDFNMGAMENKGLNVFNSKFVLAKPETATDLDYQGIEGVIGHEYFHNWSGNRVTCRDWFQLSLKEGFTVFRDQEFSADMTSRGVKRIQEVNILRNTQFKEDSGPMAHPVRPESYVEINNFYTVTVYNKGAEVVRMLHTLLGDESFRKGTDLYFERHDGQAVTTNDFIKALEDANNVDFSQFKNWYSQAGTPELHITRHYDADARTFTLNIKQSCPATPGQAEKAPFHIPLAIGLLDKNGKNLPLRFKGEQSDPQYSTVLPLKKAQEQFVFANLNEAPVPSLLRGFSAPVKIKIDLSNDELGFLMAHDSDDFNRWDAGQQLGVNLGLALIKDYHAQKPLVLAPVFIDSFKKTLLDSCLHDSMKAQIFSLPMESYLSDFMQEIDPVAVHDVLLFMKKEIAKALKTDLLDTYQACVTDDVYSLDQKAVGRRSLKNRCLSYLMELHDESIEALCIKQYKSANNMTDVIASLVALANSQCEFKQQALDDFYANWKQDPLVIDKWLSIQATSRVPDTLKNVSDLTAHESFSIKNPNKVRALIGAFCGNTVNFHHISGSGYEFLTEYVLKLDALNPQISARLVSVFSLWRRYENSRQDLMKSQLERILASDGLSKDVYEIVAKSLV